MAQKTYTLKFATLGEDLDDFQLTSNGGLVTPPMANRTQLLAGLSIIVDEAATVLTVTSTGLCTNSTTVNLPATNPPTGGGGTPPCAGVAASIMVTLGAEYDSGITTVCTDDFGTPVSSGHPVMKRDVTFTLIDCEGTQVLATTNLNISVRLNGTYCGGPGTIYQTATILAGNSSATISYTSQEVDNGGDYNRCGCYNTYVAYGGSTSPNYPVDDAV